MNKYNFYVEGMHCNSCELFLENSLKANPKIKKVNADHKKMELTVFSEVKPIVEDLNKLIEGSDYKITESNTTLHASTQDFSEWIKASAIAIVIFGLFILLQKSGLATSVNPETLSLPFVFLIGVIASISTCMAVVGGLVLSLSSGYAKAHRTTPLIIFHAFRLISFFILGGLIGLVGATFMLTPTITAIMSAILFAVMLGIGLNLLGIKIPYLNFQLTIPKIFGHKVLSISKGQNYVTPALLGAATFILPCGFTQAMQIYTLTTGSFFEGGITMLVYSLGTLPVLAGISIASVKLAETFKNGVFFKTAGLIVILFAILNLYFALVAARIIQPIINI